MTKGILWIKLTEESKMKLLNLVPTLYPKIFADHVTLFYNIELSDEYTSLLKAQVEISLKTNSYNDRIQAVTIDIGDLPSQNTFPHITVSAKDGIKPVESNTMLRLEHTSMSISGEIEGIVDFKKL